MQLMIIDVGDHVFLFHGRKIMLVLSRRPSQTVRVGPVVIMVVEVCGDKVRLGFDAPRSIPVVRTELEECEPFNPRQYTKDVLSLLAVQLGFPDVERKVEPVVDQVLFMMECK
jgi:carbon storage regulator CsrA